MVLVCFHGKPVVIGDLGSQEVFMGRVDGMASKGQDRVLAGLLVTNFPWGELSAEAAGYWINNRDKISGMLLKSLEEGIERTLAKIYADLLVACKQDWVDGDLRTLGNYELEDDGTGDEPILEINLNREVDDEEARQELAGLGWKPVGLKRAMEYIATHPTAQTEKHVVVLVSDGNIDMPYFYYNAAGQHCFGIWPSHLKVPAKGACILAVKNKENSELKPIINCDIDPFVPEGWEVLENKKVGRIFWDVSNVTLFLSKRQTQGRRTTGHQICEETKSSLPLNASVLDYLLVHKQLVPDSWKFNRIYFWGTIYLAGRCRCVRYLFWNGTTWGWDYTWLDNDWQDNYFAALLTT